MKRVLCFGEIMFRLTPHAGQQQLVRASTWGSDFAGAESNVATNLAWINRDNPDFEAHFISKLPKNSLGDAAIDSLRHHGVHTDQMLRGGDRIGTYFIEMGFGIRPSKVLYDRSHSAISTASPEEFDWPNLLDGCDWLHLGGITPALSENCATMTINATRAAKSMGITVSFDMNFRRSLWDGHESAAVIFDSVLENTDVLFGNAGVLADVYQMSGANGQTSAQQTQSLMKEAAQRWNVGIVAFTRRSHDSASRNELQGFALSGKDSTGSRPYTVDVKDRLGTGDAFAAGFIHAMLNGWELQRAVEFATAAFAIKHSISGDQNSVSEAEVQSIAAGHTQGHIVR